MAHAKKKDMGPTHLNTNVSFTSRAGLQGGQAFLNPFSMHCAKGGPRQKGFGGVLPPPPPPSPQSQPGVRDRDPGGFRWPREDARSPGAAPVPPRAIPVPTPPPRPVPAAALTVPPRCSAGSRSPPPLSVLPPVPVPVRAPPPPAQVRSMSPAPPGEDPERSDEADDFQQPSEHRTHRRVHGDLHALRGLRPPQRGPPRGSGGQGEVGGTSPKLDEETINKGAEDLHN
ncbi:uncharacterized protein LOC127393840 [Apus apus]|uniref:uncharacterized protein LOC127393840 n=1 Tax=Apus apus TaxID=8895 RepID=UPI0021F831C9|nr:uncharacterized protein LOC127393840 [Apus apus]